MNIYEVKARTPQLMEKLLMVWEQSVRATHLFLSQEEIEKIKAYVPQALENVPCLIAAEEENVPLAFMGVAGGRLEMLFLVPSARGKGLGKKLLHLGIEEYGVQEVTVNEQNPQAVGLYHLPPYPPRQGRQPLPPFVYALAALTRKRENGIIFPW